MVDGQAVLGLVGPHQVVLFVVHLGRVSPHAVDRQQQVHEGEGGVEPKEVSPGKDSIKPGQVRLK